MLADTFNAQNVPTSMFGYTFVKMIRTYPTHIIFHATDSMNIPVIIYLFNIDTLNKLNLREEVKNRLEKIKTIVHPNIATINQVQIDEMLMFLVTEDLIGTNLEEYIMSTTTLSDNEVLRISKCIFDACTYLHGKGLFHGELRPENIIFDANMNPKLTFFGFSENNMTAIHSHENKILNYIPPEIFQNTKSNPLSTDIWACGVIVYTMLFGALPFNQPNQIKQINTIIQCKYTIPSLTNQIAVSIISRCLVPSPDKRVTAARISSELREVNISPYRNKISRAVAKSHTCVASNRYAKIELLAKQGLFQFRRKELSTGSPSQALVGVPDLTPTFRQLKNPVQSSVF